MYVLGPILYTGRKKWAREIVKSVYGKIYFPVEKFRKVQDKIENRFVSCDKFQGHR